MIEIFENLKTLRISSIGVVLARDGNVGIVWLKLKTEVKTKICRTKMRTGARDGDFKMVGWSGKLVIVSKMMFWVDLAMRLESGWRLIGWV